LAIGQGTVLNLDGIEIEEVDGDHLHQGEEDLDHAQGIGGGVVEAALETGGVAADPGIAEEAGVILVIVAGGVDQGIEGQEVAAGIGKAVPETGRVVPETERAAQEIAKIVDHVANQGLDPNQQGGLDPNRQGAPSLHGAPSPQDGPILLVLSLHGILSLNLLLVPSPNLLLVPSPSLHDVPNLSLLVDQGLHLSQKAALAVPLSLNTIRLMETLTWMMLMNHLKK